MIDMCIETLARKCADENRGDGASWKIVPARGYDRSRSYSRTIYIYYILFMDVRKENKTCNITAKNAI